MESHNRSLMSSLFSGHYVYKRHPCFCIVLDGSFYLYLMFHGVKIPQLTCFSGNKYLDYFLSVAVTLFWTNVDLFRVTSPFFPVGCIFRCRVAHFQPQQTRPSFANMVSSLHTLTRCPWQSRWLCVLGNTFSGLLSFWFQYAFLC